MIPLSVLSSCHLWEARICRKASAVFGLVSCCGIPKVTDVKVFLLYLHLQEMSLGHSSICGASDTLLAGSAGVQKVEDVFFPSCSRCTWHHTGVSLLSDLLVVFFGVNVSIFTWNQVRMLRSDSPVLVLAGCSLC